MKQLLLKDQLPLLLSISGDNKIESVAMSLNPKGFSYEWTGRPSTSLKKSVLDFFEAYLQGQNGLLPEFNWKAITPFTQAVLNRLSYIKPGKTLSYLAVAKEIGAPKGSRAVGGACGRNPFPFFIPCHRVIAASGKLGGFSCGLNLKEELLKFEKAFI